MTLIFRKSVLAICFLFTGIQIALAQSQTTLLLDDFESFPLNAFDQETAVFDSNAIIVRQVVKDYEAYCQHGKSLSLSYDVSAGPDSFCGDVSFLPGSDLSGYHYLSFWIRGTVGGEYVNVEMERGNGEIAKVAVFNYLDCGPSTDWQKVVIPLDAFWNLTALTGIEKLTIVFDYYTSSSNQSPLAGEVHFDDFLFGTFHPDYVRLDGFGDLIGSNATGGNNGDFSQFPGTDNYWSETLCSQNNCQCELLLHYDNGQEDAFGGAFFILGGDSTGWIPVGKNISDYDTLYLETYALNSATNPGNFKVELKGNQVNKYQVTGINLNDQLYSIPFLAFTPQPFDPNGINEFTVVFEENV
jgi:Carbohydrate binding domain (family 11)